jgi:hypothetical protein
MIYFRKQGEIGLPDNKLESYRQFTSREEAKAWGNKHYGQWFSEIQRETLGCMPSHPILTYSGSWYKAINRYMRAGNNNDDELNNDIASINEEMNKFELPENIVVYRYSYKSLLKAFCSTSNVQKHSIIEDKAFLSTTLFKESLKDFARQNRCDCLLKLYLPKGTHGVYIGKVNHSVLDEQEFLLPPHLSFTVLNVKWKLLASEYECMVSPK